MFISDRRKYNRLSIKFALSCYKVGRTVKKSCGGSTVNVSPGGLCFETTVSTFRLGELLKIELSIPPTTGVLEFGGRIAGFARVLRTHNIHDFHTETSSSSGRYGIALQFCQSPKLCM